MQTETGQETIQARYDLALKKYIFGMENGKPHFTMEASVEVQSLVDKSQDLEIAFNLTLDVAEYNLTKASQQTGRENFALIKAKNRGKKGKIIKPVINQALARAIYTVNKGADSGQIEFDENGEAISADESTQVKYDQQTGVLTVGNATLGPEASRRVSSRFLQIDERLREVLGQYYDQLGEQYHRQIIYLLSLLKEEGQGETEIDPDRFDNVLRANLRPRLLLSTFIKMDPVNEFSPNGTAFKTLYTEKLDPATVLRFVLACHKTAGEEITEAKLISYLLKKSQFRIQELAHLDENSEYQTLLSNLAGMNVYIFQNLMLGPRSQEVIEFLDNMDKATVEGIGRSLQFLTEQTFGPANYVSVKNGSGFENHPLPMADKAVEDFAEFVFEEKRDSRGLAYLADYLLDNYGKEATDLEKWWWVLVAGDDTFFFPASREEKREITESINTLRAKLIAARGSLPRNIRFAFEDRISEHQLFGSQEESVSIDIQSSQTPGEEAQLKITKGKFSVLAILDDDMRLQIPESFRTLMPFHSLDLERKVLSTYLDLLPKAQIEETRRVVHIQSPISKKRKQLQSAVTQPKAEPDVTADPNGKTLVYTDHFEKALERLGIVETDLVRKRLELIEQGVVEPAYMARTPHLVGYYYIRAGDFRILMTKEDQAYILETVGKRDSVYKQN